MARDEKENVMLRRKLEDLQDKYEDLKRGAIRFEKKAESKIAEKPIESVLISFGVGVLAGAIAAALIARRRH